MNPTTYNLAVDAPPAWSWENYMVYLDLEWPKCLNSATSERIVQHFLEKHPCLLPGGQGGGESNAGHHGTFRPVVISQPELTGTFARVPDFMWLTRHSDAVIPVLIEIESPKKKWFTAAGTETAQLTQARNQLREWQMWMDQPENQLVFRDRYDLNGIDFDRRPLAPKFWLIYGRRSEATANERANRGRIFGNPVGTDAMTFDRLEASPRHHSTMTVSESGGKYTVKHVPPTFQLGPDIAEHLSHLGALDLAIERNQFLDRDRKDFLLERLCYWMSWAADRELKGSYSYAHLE